MGNLLTRNKIIENIAKGKATFFSGSLSTSTATSTAVQASGFFSIQLYGGAIGTTYPTSFQSIPLEISSSVPARLTFASLTPSQGTVARTFFSGSFL